MGPVVNVQLGVVDERVIDVVVFGSGMFLLSTGSDDPEWARGWCTFFRLGLGWSSWVSSPSLSLMSGLGGGGVGGRWPEALASAAISTSYFSGPPSLISSRTVSSGCGGGGSGGGVAERERGRACFDDFGFGPVPAAETGFVPATDADGLIFLDGGGLASWPTSVVDVRPSLPERGPTELSRLLSTITSLCAEMAELWNDVGSTSMEEAGER